MQGILGENIGSHEQTKSAVLLEAKSDFKEAISLYESVSRDQIIMFLVDGITKPISSFQVRGLTYSVSTLSVSLFYSLRHRVPNLRKQKMMHKLGTEPGSPDLKP